MRVLSLYDKKIFILLIGSIVSLAFLYIYFIQQAVLNVVERERLSNEIDTLHSRVADLESRYASLKGAINLPTALSLGFKEVSVAQFIERKSLSTISRNTFE